MKKSVEAEIVTLSSDPEDDYSNNVIPVIPDTSSSSLQVFQPNSAKISSNLSSKDSLPLGLTGFINDCRMLTGDIERLKLSNKNLAQNLQETQLKLNKASYEWCTSQAQLAKDEMKLKTQNVQILNLQQQANDIRLRNQALNSNISSVGQGLGTLFQTSTKLYTETTEDEAEAVGPLIASRKQIVPFKPKLKLQSVPKSKSLISFGKTPRFLDGIADQRHKFLATNLKLENLREKFTKRMSEKQQFQQEIKADLEAKNKLLQNIGQLILKRNLMIVLPKLDLQKNGLQNKTNGKMNHSQKTQLNGNSTALTNPHVRDFSIPIRKGYACICGKHFNFIATLHYHLGKHDASSKKFACNVCSKSFLYFHSLSHHLRDSHKRYFPRNTHGCRTCGAVFPNRNEFMKGWEHRNGRCIERKV